MKWEVVARPQAVDDLVDPRRIGTTVDGKGSEKSSSTKYWRFSMRLKSIRFCIAAGTAQKTSAGAFQIDFHLA